MVQHDPPKGPQDGDRVSRRRYERERRARKEAEALLEGKTRALYEANEALRAQARRLEAEVRRRTADLEAAKVEAEDSSAAKSAFLAMISHEIRTPLNGLLGMGAALTETTLDAEQAEMASLMLSSGDTLLTLLNDILDLTKIEARQMEVERIPLDLPALAASVQQLFALKARQKGLTLAVNVEDSAWRHILGDPTRLRQVLSNLLSNAVKFTEAGDVTLRLWIDAGLGHCVVMDTGPGIDEDQRGHLFEAFAQAGSSITRRFGGTGLGLTIAREICRLMGGDLTYTPRPGGGAVFHATFEAREVAPSSGRAEAPYSECERFLASRPWRILAAEDNQTNQRVIDLMLRRYGVSLTIVGDGAAAVRAHCAEPFDLILMDVNMPEMNGLEAASFVRQFEHARDLPRVPIIALTANAMTHQVHQYLKQGIDSHVAKPVRRAVLAETMARLLRRAQDETSAKDRATL
ncbi:ATP-binding protein [Primorskyibacter sp. 2E107]|uniref:ATP-binding protein n=1 Tax=Primorskyibacter sp. 2E107 TaxID=3403458 RepID=UPI003AF750BA